MRKFLAGAVMTLLAPVAAMAQDAPKVEVFGGYSYAHTRDISLNGFEGSVAGNVNDWFGIKADFSGHYGSDDSVFEGVFVPGAPTPFPTLAVDSNVKQHAIMVGPQFTKRMDRVNLFGHVLAGAARRDDKVTFTGLIPTGTPGTFKTHDTGFAAAIGAGVDVKLTDGLYWRAIQADYMPTNIYDNTDHGARVSTGLVITFGK